MTKKSRDRRVQLRNDKRTTKSLQELGTSLKDCVYKGPDVDNLLKSLNN